MRFERIHLEKYGAIESREIDLSDKPGLVVIFGPNEAGKSTLLSAISDFLYGVPHNSPHGAVFGNPQITIAASLRLADDRRLTLRRRKGRTSNVLVDGANTPVEEGQLTAILGGTPRGRFESLFGLNHASLREGGHELLAADGEIGRLIVEAGGGLRSLVLALKDLEAEADTLFHTTRAGKRRYYPAYDAFMAADKSVKAAVTSRDVFLKAGKAVTDTAAELAGLRAAQKAAREQISHDERLKRIAPQLRLLAEVESELGTFSDIDALPERFAEDVATALTARSSAEATLADVTTERDARRDALAQLSLQPDIVAAGTGIEAALAYSQHVAKARQDRPKRMTELAESEARLATLRQSLGAGSDTDLAERAPTALQIDAAQALAAEVLTLDADLKGAVTLKETIESELQGLSDRQAVRRKLGFDKPNAIPAADLNRLIVVDRDVNAKRKACGQARANIAAQCTDLGLGDFEALKGGWPTPGAISVEGERRTTFALEKKRIEEACRAAKSRLGRARTRKARLLEGVVAPTPAAIEQARAARDDSWGVIKTVYLDAPDAGWLRPGESERQAHAMTYETGRALADGLADRASAESERLAEIASAERDIEDATEVLAEEEANLQALVQREQAATLDWDRAWPDVVAIEPNLGRLQVLTTQRVQLQGALRDLVASEIALTALQGELDDLMAVLELTEGGASATQTEALGRRVQAALTALKAHDDGYAAFGRDEEAIETAKGRQRLNDRALVKLAAAKEAWIADWRMAMAALGLAEATTPKRATEVATQWAAATGVFNEIRLTATRIRRMAQDEAELVDAVDALRDTLNILLPADPVAAALAAKNALDAALQVHSQAQTLRPIVEGADVRHQLASEALGRATSTLDALAVSAVCTVDELPARAARVAQRADAKARQTQIRDTILLAGDGLSLETLRTQWRSRDPDALTAGLADLVGQETAREEEIETAIAKHQAAERDVSALLSDTSLNSLIVEREVAAREMAAMIERYAEVKIAIEVLRAAVDQVRMAQQDPLLLRAGALFSACTRGDFSGVGADVDEAGTPIVVGLRSGGAPVAIKEMSDGTRDQLFLAFRLASIQHYGHSAEPIPFIADDILVHFDDARGASALELLADSGLQVLLFTHHAAVVHAAKPLIATGRAHLVDLAGDHEPLQGVSA